MRSSTVKRVDIVGEEPTICVVLQKILERAGMKVSSFGSADECLAHLDTQRCGLLITDVKLPGKDGMELLTEARKRLPWLPVLVVTGYGDVPMAIKAMKVGAADFLEKPLDRDVFLEAARDLLVRGAAHSALLSRDRKSVV